MRDSSHLHISHSGVPHFLSSSQEHDTTTDFLLNAVDEPGYHKIISSKSCHIAGSEVTRDRRIGRVGYDSAGDETSSKPDSTVPSHF